MTTKRKPPQGPALDRKLDLLWKDKEKMERLLRDILQVNHIDRKA